MDIQIRQAAYEDVAAMRELYRQEANCQIIRDSALQRNLADPYLILCDGRLGGYASVWNKYTKNRLMEFFILPHLRASALPIFRAVLETSQATHIEAQTNMPLMLLMLYDCATHITSEAILFEDAFTSSLPPPEGVLRPVTPEDASSIFQHHDEPVGNWLIEAKRAIVATGGFYSHYNPPYGDIFMEVSEPSRRQGYGSYMAQELKRLCYEAGKKPAARCNPDNIASRRTMQKAGLLPCAHMLVGEVDLQH